MQIQGHVISVYTLNKCFFLNPWYYSVIRQSEKLCGISIAAMKEKREMFAAVIGCAWNTNKEQGNEKNWLSLLVGINVESIYNSGDTQDSV